VEIVIRECVPGQPLTQCGVDIKLSKNFSQLICCQVVSATAHGGALPKCLKVEQQAQNGDGEIEPEAAIDPKPMIKPRKVGFSHSPFFIASPDEITAALRTVHRCFQNQCLQCSV
jgi:hypothetical protein